MRRKDRGSFPDGEGVRVSKLPETASDRGQKRLVPKPPKRLSVLEYARKRGCSEQRVRQLIDRGKLSAKKVKGRLTLDPVEADREWENNVDHRSTPKSLRKDETPQSCSDDKDGFKDADLDVKITQENAAVQLRIAEAKREVWRAKQAKLDFEEKSGQLVSAAKVQRDAFEIARTVRDAILTIPDRLSPELIGITDQATMHSVLTKALVAVLDEMTNGIEKRFGVPSGVHGGNETGSASDGEPVGG